MANLYYSLHVSGLPHDTTQKELTDLFMEAGDVKNVHIAGRVNDIDPAIHRFTYGFVRYASKEECQHAIQMLDKWPLRTKHKLTVTMAHDQRYKARSSTEGKAASDQNFDPRAIKALHESLGRLGLEGQMSALVSHLGKVDYKPVQNWTCPKEDLQVNLTYLDSLTQEIEELENAKKGQFGSNSDSSSKPYNDTGTSQPVSDHKDNSGSDVSLASNAQSSQCGVPSQRKARSSSSTDKMSVVEVNNVPSGDVSLARDGTSKSDSFCSVSEENDNKSQILAPCKSGLASSTQGSRLAETERPVCIGRGVLGRGQVTKGNRDKKPGQGNTTTVPTGRGRAILEKYKQLD